MPNNDRTKDDAGWVDGYAPTPSEWASLDGKTFRSWNGDRGGAYAPSEEVKILGSGLRVTGPVRLTGGGRIQGASTNYFIPNDKWPALGPGHVGAKRKIVQPISAFQSPIPYLWSREHPYGGVGSIALAARQAHSRTVEIPEIFVPIRVIDGSRVTEIEFHFRVALPRTKAPIAMPKFRVLRVPRNPLLEQPTPLKATSDGLGFASPANVTSPDAWYSGGQPQKFVYVCDQNQVIDVENYSYVAHIIEEQGVLTPDDAFDGICFAERKADVEFRDVMFDPSFKFSDFAPITPAIGGLYLVADGWWFDNLDKLNGITDTLFYHTLVMSDGVTIQPFGDDGASRRLLIANYSDTDDDPSHLNGIWNTLRYNGVDSEGTGDQQYWTRARDVDEVADFSPNWFVVVQSGWSNGGSVFQCQYPDATKSVELWVNDQYKRTLAGVDDDGKPVFKPRNPNPVTPTFAAKISITPAKPRGNIYHSIVPTFEVSDLRFQ